MHMDPEYAFPYPFRLVSGRTMTAPELTVAINRCWDVVEKKFDAKPWHSANSSGRAKRFAQDQKTNQKMIATISRRAGKKIISDRRCCRGVGLRRR